METRYAFGIVIAILIIIGIFAVSGSGSTPNSTSLTPLATSTITVEPSPVGASSTPTAGAAQPGATTLAIGQSDSVAGVTLKPLSVVEDSRCPAGVYCIQAGTVRVSAQVTGSGVSTVQTFTFGHTLIARNARITLTGVAPLKTASSTIAASDYRLTFAVSPVTQ